MTHRLQNFFMAIMLAVATLFWAQTGTTSSSFFENPTSGGYQLFEASDSGIFTNNPLNVLEKIFASPETAPECCNAPNGGDKPKVTAEAEIDGQKITGTNQGARDPDLADPNTPTLIEGRVQAQVDKDGKERPNSNMADAHAEVEVIQNAYDQGLTQGRDMHINVEGEPICTYCRSDIRDMADEAGLNSVSVTHTNRDGVRETVTWSRNEDGTMERRPTEMPVE